MSDQPQNPVQPPQPPAAPRFESPVTGPWAATEDVTQTAFPAAPVAAANPAAAPAPAPAPTPRFAPTDWSTPAAYTPAAATPAAQVQFAPPQAPAAPAQAASKSRGGVTPALLIAAIVGTAVLTSGGTYLAVSAGRGQEPGGTASQVAVSAPGTKAPAGGGNQNTPPAQLAPAPTQQAPAPVQPVNPGPAGAQGSIVDIVKSVSPAVVTIQVDGVTSTDILGGSAQGSAVGSGVIFDANGLILTNRHVVSGDPTKLTVMLKDGRSFAGSVYGIDTMTDLAIVKIDATGLPTANIGDSSQIQVGQQAIAIGSPLGEFTDSVTSGIVSALGRSIDVDTGSLSNLIQTDTAINPGNSGGPLLDATGTVVGINTAVASGSQGIGFAIPINIARPMLKQASAGQPLTRAWLGVRFQTIDPALKTEADLPVANGAWIPSAAALQELAGQDPNGGQGVDPNGGMPGVLPNGGDQGSLPQAVDQGSPIVAGSPAAAAGLAEGDIVTAINGTQLDATHTLDLTVGQMAPGDTATLTVLRDGKEITLTVTLGTRPASA